MLSQTNEAFSWSSADAYAKRKVSKSERSHSTIRSRLGNFRAQHQTLSWAAHVLGARESYNLAIHSTTGRAPMALFFNRVPNSGVVAQVDARKDKAVKRMIQRSLRMIKDKALRDKVLAKGDLVHVRTTTMKEGMRIANNPMLYKKTRRAGNEERKGEDGRSRAGLSLSPALSPHPP